MGLQMRPDLQFLPLSRIEACQANAAAEALGVTGVGNEGGA
jgi:hypothetical protein